MRKYFTFFKMRLLAGFQYRSAAWAGVGTQFFWGLMYIMIFMAFYRSSDGNSPMSLTEIVQYFWLQQALFPFLFAFNRDAKIAKSIISGDLAYELVKPLSLYRMWFASIFSSKLAATILRSWPILLISFLMPGTYRFVLPSSFGVFGLFLVTLSFALIINVLLGMFMYYLMFITLEIKSTVTIFANFSSFLSGGLIPLAFMPLFITKLNYFLPFRLGYDVPLRVYSGNIAGSEVLISIGLQVIWIIILFSLGNLLFSKRLKKIVVQGG